MTRRLRLARLRRNSFCAAANDPVEQRHVATAQHAKLLDRQAARLGRGVGTGQEDLLIEFDKSRVPEFGARLGPPSPRDRRFHSNLGELTQKLAHMHMDRFGAFLENEQPNAHEGEDPLTGKILGADAMALTELGGMQARA